MYNDVPTLEEWKALYGAARMFKEFEPWEWMEDGDVFGIEDPESGELGYCCVLGALGEVYGLIVYLGSEGLELYERLQAGEIDAESDAIFSAQKCLALTFDDRNMLEKKDLDIIKSLGLKFRGRQAWPCFRSHVPGFVPWFLAGSQVRFLELALRHAMGMGERLRENPDLLVPPEQGVYLVAYSDREDRCRTWREEWIKPTPFVRERPPVLIDEVRLARIKAGARRVEQAWEVDFFFAPFVVDEGGRPFFPYAALYCERNRDFVINITLAPHASFEGQFLSNFYELLEKVQALPKAIVVKQDLVFDFFDPVAAALGIPLKKIKNLKSVEAAKAALMDRMGG